MTKVEFRKIGMQSGKTIHTKFIFVTSEVLPLSWTTVLCTLL